MSNIAQWNAAAAAAAALSTELNSLGSNSLSSASATIDNATNKHLYMDVELVLASFSPGTTPYVTIYLLESLDGTNFPAAAAALRNTPTQVLCTVPLDTTAASAQRVVVRNLLIPPVAFKLALDNQSGAALASSGNAVNYRTYDVNLNA